MWRVEGLSDRFRHGRERACRHVTIGQTDKGAGNLLRLPIGGDGSPRLLQSQPAQPMASRACLLMSTSGNQSPRSKTASIASMKTALDFNRCATCDTSVGTTASRVSPRADDDSG